MPIDQPQPSRRWRLHRRVFGGAAVIAVSAGLAASGADAPGAGQRAAADGSVPAVQDVQGSPARSAPGEQA
jgi:hypothetical protein